MLLHTSNIISTLTLAHSTLLRPLSILFRLKASLYLPRLFGSSLVFWYAWGAPFHSSSVIKRRRIMSSLSAVELGRRSNVTPFPSLVTRRGTRGVEEARLVVVFVWVGVGSVDRLWTWTRLIFEICLSIPPISSATVATTLFFIEEDASDSRLCNGRCEGRGGWRIFNWVPPLAVAGDGTIIRRCMLRTLSALSSWCSAVVCADRESEPGQRTHDRLNPPLCMVNYM